MSETISKHKVKITVATSIIVILFIIVTSVNFATWRAEMNAEHNEFDDRITHVGDKVIDMRIDINALKEKANNRDVELATINAKLTNIETLLIDIKQDIKDK